MQDENLTQATTEAQQENTNQGQESESKNTESKNTDQSKPDDKKFSQKELDEILEKRIARETAKHEKELEKALKDQEAKFKMNEEE